MAEMVSSKATEKSFNLSFPREQLSASSEDEHPRCSISKILKLGKFTPNSSPEVGKLRIKC